MVDDEDPIKIDVDLSTERLQNVYSDIFKTANDISEFYKKIKCK